MIQAQELIDSCPKTNLGRMVVRIKPTIPTAQEIIDLPDNWRNVDIAQWFTRRMREVNKHDTYP